MHSWSPGCMMTVACPGRASTEPSARITVFSPTCPGSPPARPKGGMVRQLERIAAVIGSRNSICRTMPLPPGYCPAPPLWGRMANSFSRAGNRHSSISGSVRRELVMWVGRHRCPKTQAQLISKYGQAFSEFRKS